MWLHRSSQLGYSSQAEVAQLQLATPFLMLQTNFSNWPWVMVLQVLLIIHLNNGILYSHTVASGYEY